MMGVEVRNKCGVRRRRWGRWAVSVITDSGLYFTLQCLQTSLFARPRRIPRDGRVVGDRDDVQAAHLQPLDGGHAARSDAAHLDAHRFDAALDGALADGDGGRLGGDVRALARVLEALDTARADQQRSACETDTLGAVEWPANAHERTFVVGHIDDGVVGRHFDVADGDLVERDAVEQARRCVLVREDVHLSARRKGGRH